MKNRHDARPAGPGAVPSGWLRARRIAGYGAAGTMALYLAVKVTWVVGGLLGAVPGAFTADAPGWIALNVITVGMAAVGISLGLALAQPWGKHLPGWLVILSSWIASGLLVSLLPHSVLSALLGAATAEAGSVPDPFPRWESALIAIGFVGMAVGLLVAVPVYMRERWPSAFTGRSGSGGPAVASARLIACTLAAATIPAALWAYWAGGGTLGLNADALELWNLDARLLVGTSAVWAVIGALSAWALSGRSRARLPTWLPMAAGFVASGSLVAWNAWRALWLLLPITGVEQMRSPGVAVIEHCTAIAAGLAIMTIVMRAYRVNASGGRWSRTQPAARSHP
ncbi:hypothetical protein [Agrococcus sp. ARC_14]|uniref:hypothetical protein n=1 Tax=Agrococcus sp. ARC_14 TaxID=2919927 RepID=UPI001F0556A7|nr:hypothetical protein [Agrococcus sp. ARC_14]MCH1883369.1 hypothetical protein [Agrococcus sp. ARC_14]